MHIITLDFETFYDRDYSLTKMSTEEYIRDPRFETIGVAIKLDDGPIRWYPKPAVRDALQDLPWNDALLVGQNTMFDAAILAWHYDIHPKMLGDIMLMSRALFPHEKSHSLKAQAERLRIGEKGDEVINALGRRYADFTDVTLAAYASYCCNDVHLTYDLFSLYLNYDDGFPANELKVIDLTLKMFVEPKLRLDGELLKDHLESVRDAKAQALQTASTMVRPMVKSAAEMQEVLSSNPQFAELLNRLGVEVPMKISPATGKETLALAKTDEGFLALQEHPDVAVQALVAARLGVKSTLEETRTEQFLNIASRGLLPIPLRYYGAHTGRWSGIDGINLQNLPSRDPRGKALKRSIMPLEGHVIVEADSSQIEARTLAWLAGQTDLVQAFARKEDIYKIMAGHIYGKRPEEVTEQERQIGKTVILGCGYGAGARALQGFLKIQAKVELKDSEARSIVRTYRTTYGRIPDLWSRAEQALHSMIEQTGYTIDAPGLIRTCHKRNALTLPNGLYLEYPNLAKVYRDDKEGWTYESKKVIKDIYGGKVVENFTQAVARCIIAEQMVRVAKRFPVVMTVHDSLVVVAPEAVATDAMEYVRECMSWTPTWAKGLPLACKVGMGANYGDC